MIGRIAVLGVLALLLASCGGDEEPVADAETPAPTKTATPTPTPTPTATATPDHSSGYPAAVRREFVRLCRQDDSRSYCRCLMDYIATRVPYGQFSRVAENKTPRGFQKALEDGIRACD
jgi:hypothetical protein